MHGTLTVHPPIHYYRFWTKQKLYTLVRQRFGSEDVKLVFDGDALDEEDTPEGLDMEDEDLIDVQGI